MKAVIDVSADMDVALNSAVTIVDAAKCKMYMKNFGEFFNNQIENAGTIVLSRTDITDPAKIQKDVELIREKNPKAAVVTTPLGELGGDQLLEIIEKRDTMLDDMLEVIDLSREKNVYIANMVKCRPPQNRDPLNTEQDACIGYLRNQVALIRPKIIVCLGRIAAMRLIKPDFKITKEHGQWFEKSGVQMMALFHPAAILRDPRRRPETFEDLKRLQAKIQEICDHTY